MPETPRYLVSKGRMREAYEVFKLIAKVNGKVLNPAWSDWLHGSVVSGVVR